MWRAFAFALQFVIVFILASGLNVANAQKQAAEAAKREAIIQALKAKAIQLQNQAAVAEAQAESDDETTEEPDMQTKPKSEKAVESKTADNPKLDKAKIAELTAKIKKEPNNYSHYIERCIEYTKAEAWKEAVADLSEVPKLKEGDSQLGQQLCILFVLADDKDSYEIVCEEMLKRYGETGNAWQQERVAKACSLSSNPVGNVQEILAMAEKSLEANYESNIVMHFYRTQALAQYRAKKYAEAQKTIQEGESRDPSEVHMIANAMMCHRGIETMCLWQLGKKEEARKSLAKAKADLEKAYREDKTVYQKGNWHDWLTAKLLILEAEELLKKPME